ncbi:MAG: phage tail protein [Oscillospiraceae bacterium]|nr:phage tail protein [Oscillospiraceae bacterium]
MADFFHGARTQENPTSVSTPVVAASGITFAIGTAPVHTTDSNNVNRVIRAGSYSEAVSALGYMDSTDGWKNYELCEVIFNHFRLYQTAPVFFVNVLDPAVHKEAIASKAYPIINNRATLPFEAIKKSVTVQSYEAGTDYALFYTDTALILEIIDDGSIPASTTELTIGYNAVKPSMVTKADIIGGFNLSTKKTTGLELIDTVLPAFGTVPDLIIAPGFSHDPEVAAVMSAKADGINGLFKAKALIDIDVSANGIKHYSESVAWKKKQNIFDSSQILFCFKCGLGDRVFHMSTQAAALMAVVDTRNGGIPSESPSNKSLQIDRLLLDNGTEVLLDIQAANFLNANGIVTALNFSNGFTLWGNYTACYPGNTDVKDYFISVSRMFAWRGRTAIFTFWSRVDERMTNRFATSIIDSLNIHTNGLVAEGHLLGGRIELPAELNNDLSLASGKITLKIIQTPPTPAQEILFLLEFDMSYLSTIFG